MLASGVASVNRAACAAVALHLSLTLMIPVFWVKFLLFLKYISPINTMS